MNKTRAVDTSNNHHLSNTSSDYNTTDISSGLMANLVSQHLLLVVVYGLFFSTVRCVDIVPQPDGELPSNCLGHLARRASLQNKCNLASFM
jgi:hypothetical protein